MAFDSTLAAIRFGTGRSPRTSDPTSPEAMLSALAGPDRMAATHVVPFMDSIFPVTREINEIYKARRDGDTSDAQLLQMRELRRSLQAQQFDLMAQTMARGIDAEDGLRERLTWFWADHFTVTGKSTDTRSATSMFVEEAIRPHVAGRFADMLKAVVQHPMMLLYLDQHRSVGPNSPFGKQKAERGLNENLAREVLELHTLGVESNYSQNDVRQLAELFAGLTGDHRRGFVFSQNRGEPGPETVLGRNYGRRKPKLEDVHQVLDDLAAHPATARHIGHKLAVHFVSDSPDADLVDALAVRFSETDGDLLKVTEALLTHPAAQSAPLVKTKQPFDFMVSGLRALGVAGKGVTGLKPKVFKRTIVTPLAMMGQPWQSALGPDGWPEEASHWITPQGLAVRITWAMGLQNFPGLSMPDPRQFVQHALGHLASKPVVFAAGAAETRGDGVGIVLASPDFQRR